MAQMAQNVTQRISKSTKQLRTRWINSAFAVAKLKFWPLFPPSPKRRRVSVFNFIIYAETPMCVCVCVRVCVFERLLIYNTLRPCLFGVAPKNFVFNKMPPLLFACGFWGGHFIVLFFFSHRTLVLLEN